MARAAPSDPAAASGGHVRALDGVRGLAILLVLVFHFTAVTGVEPDVRFDQALLNVTGAGWMGVDLFFVLSGFLITGILYDAKAGSGGFFRPFYARRVLRIFPVYYVFLALLLVTVPVVDASQAGAVDALRSNWLWYAGFLTNIETVIDPGIEADLVYAGHLWSLAIEEQFYLLLPALVFVLNRRVLMAVCVAAVISAAALRVGLIAAGIDTAVGYQLLPARWDTLATGALIALAARDPSDFRLLARWAAPVAVSALAVVVVIGVAQGGLSPYDEWVQSVGFSALALGFGALLVGAYTADKDSLRQAFFAHPVMTWLGRYSYALYILHWPIATILGRRLDLADRAPEIAGSSILGIVYAVAAPAALSLALAFVSWHVLEKQVLKLKARFPYARRKAGVAT